MCSIICNWRQRILMILLSKNSTGAVSPYICFANVLLVKVYWLVAMGVFDNLFSTPLFLHRFRIKLTWHKAGRIVNMQTKIVMVAHTVAIVSWWSCNYSSEISVQRLPAAWFYYAIASSRAWQKAFMAMLNSLEMNEHWVWRSAILAGSLELQQV